jgi:hypothetical protein
VNLVRRAIPVNLVYPATPAIPAIPVNLVYPATPTILVNPAIPVNLVCKAKPGPLAPKVIPEREDQQEQQVGKAQQESQQLPSLVLQCWTI